MSVTLSTELGGRTLTIETGRLARLAGGSVTVRYGDTLVLGTANRSDPRPGLDFFPLTVEFEERMYAAGKIPGGFIKREARASEAATLAARLTDRPIRPLFPEGYKDDIQLVITVLSTDQENEPDVIGTIAASAALSISEIPFHGPVGSVRIGRIDGEFVVNPTFSQLAESELDLVVSGTRDAIMMVEAGAKLLPEDVMAEAILFGHRALQPLIDIQEELQKAVGKAKITPFLEAGTGTVLDFARTVEAGGEFVIVDVETTGTDPKMADLVEIAAVRVKGNAIVDRWSTLVNPGRPIIGNQMHGITDADVAKAPKPAAAAKEALAFIGDAADRRSQRRLRPRLPGGRARRRDQLRAGSLPRHADHRPRGLPRPGELQAPDALALLRHRALAVPSRAARRRGHGESADLVRQRPAGASGDAACLDRGCRPGERGQAATPRPCSRPPAARRV